ncbi:MAG: pyruvate dehydrogenase (acetyl-transferring) E1 component subunit alpha [Steroidobacteraceae bacterium]
MEPQSTTARFEIPYFQQLTPAGKLVDPALKPDGALLRRLYEAMVRTRTFDTKAVNLQRTGKLGTYPSCLGHEATHVAIGAAMRDEDVLFTVYREIGTKFWRGAQMRDILLYWGGDERGTLYQKNRADFPFCVPIGSQLPHAAGAALAFSVRNEPRVAVAFIGDGGTSQGAFYEAINLAGARQLPLVCVVVNNGWAISVPVAAQTAARTLAQKAIAAGIPGIQVDGNDVLGVHEQMSRALERARSGGGPTLIEALTYRLSDHTTADDATRYRPAAEVEEARRLEPLVRTRALLEQLGWWNESDERQLKAACSSEVESAVQQYLETPRQSTDAMFDYLYARLPDQLIAQREQARRYAK